MNYESLEKDRLMRSYSLPNGIPSAQHSGGRMLTSIPPATTNDLCQILIFRMLMTGQIFAFRASQRAGDSPRRTSGFSDAMDEPGMILRIV